MEKGPTDYRMSRVFQNRTTEVSPFICRRKGNLDVQCRTTSCSETFLTAEEASLAAACLDQNPGLLQPSDLSLSIRGPQTSLTASYSKIRTRYGVQNEW